MRRLKASGRRGKGMKEWGVVGRRLVDAVCLGEGAAEGQSKLERVAIIYGSNQTPEIA
jgi:hypothetical protein